MSWRVFFVASVVSAALLVKVGAPLVPVAIGVALAAYFSYRRQRAVSAKR